MQEAYLGIDPGKAGGISLLGFQTRTSAPCVISAYKLENKTPNEIAEHLRELNSANDIRMGYIENVSSSPQMGVVSAFTFGKSYGFLIGLLCGINIPYEFVPPMTWQRALKCLTKGDKSISRAKAQQFYAKQLPKITNAIADSLLIATYCARKERGLL